MVARYQLSDAFTDVLRTAVNSIMSFVASSRVHQAMGHARGNSQSLIQRADRYGERLSRPNLDQVAPGLRSVMVTWQSSNRRGRGICGGYRREGPPGRRGSGGSGGRGGA
jgi:hypothetical protein